MKLTAKLFLIVSLFCSVAIADDGNMGNGGRTDPPPCTENCLVAGGTITPNDSEQANSEDSIFSIIRDYLYDLLG